MPPPACPGRARAAPCSVDARSSQVLAMLLADDERGNKDPLSEKTTSLALLGWTVPQRGWNRDKAWLFQISQGLSTTLSLIAPILPASTSFKNVTFPPSRNASASIRALNSA